MLESLIEQNFQIPISIKNRAFVQMQVQWLSHHHLPLSASNSFSQLLYQLAFVASELQNSQKGVHTRSALLVRLAIPKAININSTQTNRIEEQVVFLWGHMFFFFLKKLEYENIAERSKCLNLPSKICLVQRVLVNWNDWSVMEHGDNNAISGKFICWSQKSSSPQLSGHRRMKGKKSNTHTFPPHVTQGTSSCWSISFQQCFANKKSLHTFHNLFYKWTAWW